MNKEKTVEITSITSGLILFIAVIGIMIYSNIKYYYPNYSTNFLIKLSLELIVLVFVLFIYIKRIKRLNTINKDVKKLNLTNTT